MKKFVSLIFVSLLFFACSQEQISDIQNPDKPNGLVFKISTQQSNVQSRAGAPLYSQEATHSVTDVKVYAFDATNESKAFVKMFDLTAEPEIKTTGWGSVDYLVPENEELESGDYYFIAVGRSAGDNYNITEPVVGTTTYSDMIASIDTSGDESDLFSGVETAEVTGAGTVTINMKRKISGFLGYFTNIPSEIDGKSVHYLRLSVNSANKGVNLQSGVTSILSDGYNLIDIDLSGQATTEVEGVNVYVGNNLAGDGVMKLSNSQLAGGYMIPASGVTLTLGLYDEEGNSIKEWTVVDGNSTKINITAGGLFSLGTKGAIDDLFGKDGIEDPAGGASGAGGGDDDKGINIQDLLEHQSIIVTIDPVWDVIKELTLQ